MDWPRSQTLHSGWFSGWNQPNLEWQVCLLSWQRFLCNEESIIIIDIYAVHWFWDIHVDTVHMLSGDLFPPSTQPQKKYIQIHGYAVYGAPSPKRPSSCPKGILNIGAAIIDSSMKSKPLGYNHDNLIKPSHPVMLELHHTKSDYSSMLSSEAIARKHQAKAKKG